MSTSVSTETTTTTMRRDPTVRFRRAVGAILLPLGILFQVATNTMYSLITMDGGSDMTGESALELFSSHPTEARVTMLLAMIGSMLIVAGVPSALRVLRPTRPQLSLVAGILMMAGYIAYYGIVASSGLEITLATMNVDAAAAIDASQDDPMGFAFFPLFILGNILGTFLLGLAVILSKQVAWIAGALIMAWPVGHVTGLILGAPEWLQVGAGTLETIGLVMVAVVALKTSDTEWASRG
ncbi:hypothetical protein [Rathayibacter soli]|uniref:hypothetical protein n=1 Tax=Rathayibacter soli TaxID=3144168 RepID=UPI0027E57555|nr:hypothetical protein [Glaciibacter superstes]